MQRASLYVLIVVGILGASCSKGLRSGSDAGPDSGSLVCAGSPPAACGYVCQDGAWVATGESCSVSDAALAGKPDTYVNGTGGATAAGGATGNGGESGSGGVPASGGASLGGGTTATGGVSLQGGTVATGGATGTGGTVTTGGAGTGGAIATGGATKTGGAIATGGLTGTGGSRGVVDAGPLAGCADLSGTWRMSGSCNGPRATFSGSFAAVMTQSECSLTFTQTDDKTATQWTSSGRLENTGWAFLRGKFGFTDSIQCDLTVTAEGLDMTCGSATQQCKLKGQRDIP